MLRFGTLEPSVLGTTYPVVGARLVNLTIGLDAWLIDGTWDTRGIPPLVHEGTSLIEAIGLHQLGIVTVVEVVVRIKVVAFVFHGAIIPSWGKIDTHEV